jgi:hypothetical protein
MATIDVEAVTNDKERNEPAVLQLYDKDDKILDGVTITLYLSDSDVYKSAQYEVQNKQMRSVRKGRNPDAQTQEADGITVLVRCVKDWTGFVRAGTLIPPTPEEVRNVLENASYIRDQVADFVRGRTPQQDLLKPSANSREPA